MREILCIYFIMCLVNVPMYFRRNTTVFSQQANSMRRKQRKARTAAIGAMDSAKPRTAASTRLHVKHYSAAKPHRECDQLPFGAHNVKPRQFVLDTLIHPWRDKYLETNRELPAKLRTENLEPNATLGMDHFP